MVSYSEHIESLILSVPQNSISQLSSILQSGIVLSAPGEITIFHFLLSLPGFDSDYLSHHVQTIFLDGNAVDNFDALFNKKHHTLALSAAMPGLAGAIFRKNSRFASLRKDKTFHNMNEERQERKVTVKLFNTIARDKGKDMLLQGGQLSGKILMDYFKRNPFILEKVEGMSLNGSQIEPKNLLSLLEPDSSYFFRVTPGNNQE